MLGWKYNQTKFDDRYRIKAGQNRDIVLSIMTRFNGEQVIFMNSHSEPNSLKAYKGKGIRLPTAVISKVTNALEQIKTNSKEIQQMEIKTNSFNNLYRYNVGHNTDVVLSVMVDANGEKFVFFNSQNEPNATFTYKAEGLKIPIEIIPEIIKCLNALKTEITQQSCAQ